MNDRVVIVGGGHAAGQLIVSLQQRQFAGPVTLIGNEDSLPYQRPPLSKKYLSGDLDASRLLIKPAEFFDQTGLTVRLGAHVESIDVEQKRVIDDRGVATPYDTLVLATGSAPRTVPLPGADLRGVAYLRSIADVDTIRRALPQTERVAIVGAGYIGLEVAAVLTALGKSVTVVEALDRAMSRVVAPQISDYYHRVHEENGVRLRFSTAVQSFLGRDHVTGIEIANGERIEADLVIVGVGVVPNTRLAEDAGLEVDDGIVVDAGCRTSHSRIFAIGDCTRHPSTIYQRRLRLESVQNAIEQAKTTAANIAGDSAEYDQIPWFWSDQYDRKLQIAGISADHDQTILRHDESSEKSISCLYLRDGRLIAVDAVNRPKDFMQGKALVTEGAILDPKRAADSTLELKDLVTD